MTDTVIPGRDCGSCNACCVALTIDDPELQKPQGYRCKNAKPDNGCAIYPTRPDTCRTFNCGWRLLKWVREPLRPDRSGVLIRLHGEISEDGKRQLGIAVILMTRASLKADGLAETIAAAINADAPVYLNVPGPPGFTSGQAKLNDALRLAVQTRDKAAVLEILRRARAGGAKGERARIVLEPHNTAAPPEPTCS